MGYVQQGNDVMEFGLYVEDFIADLYERQTGRPVVDLGATAIQRHPEQDWLTATLDRVTTDERVPLELKSVQSYKIRWEDWWDGGPLHYQVQLQAQMAVTGAQWGSLAGLFFPGVWLAYVDHQRNDRFIDAAIPVLKRFWFDHVLAKVPPDPKDFRDLSALKKIYEQSKPREIIFTEADNETVAQWAHWKEEEKQAKENKQTHEAMIRARLGDAETGLLPDGSQITARTQRDGKRVLRLKEQK
jgi:predicted phage-related endonuclease